MISAVPSIVSDVAIIAGAIIALVTCARLPVISRPGKWLWKRVVSDPVGAWVDRILTAHTAPLLDRVDAIEAQLKPNHGHSMRDRVDATATAVGAEPPPE